MWTLLTYLAGVTFMSTVGYGILYAYDREMAEEFAQTVSWNAVKTYHRVNLEVDNIRRWYEVTTRERISRSDDEDEEENETELTEINANIKFIGYSENDDTTYTTSELIDNDYINENNFDLMLVKNDDDLYARLKDKKDISSVEYKKIDKPFIQVELCQDESKTSIHKKLEPFYLDGNEILDEKFLNWYVRTFYGIELDENYKVSIIDSDVNMFKIEKGKIIKLTQDTGYEIIEA
tara:strand:- start:2450 stop:3154 length:705 start_codon:yes stop_codon:yes gene_type:complete